jgi:xylulose-5-phosphate/fructose-6-phosphate phosphoketolase
MKSAWTTCFASSLFLAGRAGHLKQEIRDKLLDHKARIHERGEDLPEVRDWTWSGPTER